MYSEGFKGFSSLICVLHCMWSWSSTELHPSSSETKKLMIPWTSIIGEPNTSMKSNLLLQQFVCSGIFLLLESRKWFFLNGNGNIDKSRATSFWSHDIYSSVHPGERSSSVALLKGSSLFSLWKDFFYFLGVVPDPMWGQRSGMSYGYRL